MKNRAQMLGILGLSLLTPLIVLRAETPATQQAPDYGAQIREIKHRTSRQRKELKREFKHGKISLVQYKTDLKKLKVTKREEIAAIKAKKGK